MPRLLIYSASDFIGGLPNEVRFTAAGDGPFEVTLRPGAKPTVVEVIDNDRVFDESDRSQVLAQDVVVGGEALSAGTTIITAYDLLNLSSGHQVTSLHFGGTGDQQGPVDGLVSTVRLEPGTTYVFDRDRTSHRQDNFYEEFVACFTQGALIDTPTGRCAIETLRVGDLVETIDTGPQPIRWIGACEVSAMGELAPVRFAPGALGNDRPLEVSPEHRMLMSGARAEVLFGQTEVLIPAKALVDGVQITRVPRPQVTYMHLLLDAHEIIRVNGACAETLLLSDLSLRGTHGMDAATRLDLLVPPTVQMQAARVCLKPWEAALFAA